MRIMYYYRRKTSPLKWLILIIVSVVIGVLVYWFYVNYFSKIDFSQPEPQQTVEQPEPEEIKILKAKLLLEEGDVQINKNNQGYEQADVNIELGQSDKVRTAEDSRAIIQLENNNIIRLGENTEISLEDLAEKEIIIKQFKGRTYHNLLDKQNYHVVYANVAVSAVNTKFEFITIPEREYVVALAIENKINLEISDQNGLLMSSRIDQDEKALISLDADKNDILKIETFSSEELEAEQWYKWNFEQDENDDQFEIVDESEDSSAEDSEEEEDDEPDFSVTDDSLVLAAELNDNGAYLSWSVFAQDDFKSYQILRSVNNPDLKYPDDDTIKSSVMPSFNSFADSDLNPDQKYYYRICVVKQNDKVVCGNVRSVQTEPEEEEADNGPPQAPNLNISISSSGVALSWNTNEEDDFKEYRLVRSISNSGLTYPADGSIAVLNKSQGNYLDNSVNITSAGTYYYRVCSLDNDDNKACSNVVKIKDGKIE